jgi:CheY-like chemotaxis protein
LSKIRLLHVDPDHKARHQLKQRLPEDIELVACRVPDRAFRAFERIRPQIVLVSLNQGGTSGPVLCNRLRRAGAWTSDTILVVYSPPEDGPTAAIEMMLKIRYGVDHFVTEASTADLVTLVHKLAGQKTGPARPKVSWKRAFTRDTSPPDRVVRTRPLFPAQVVTARLPETATDPTWADLMTSPMTRDVLRQVLTKPIGSGAFA